MDRQNEQSCAAGGNVGQRFRAAHVSMSDRVRENPVLNTHAEILAGVVECSRIDNRVVRGCKRAVLLSVDNFASTMPPASQLGTPRYVRSIAPFTFGRY